MNKRRDAIELKEGREIDKDRERERERERERGGGGEGGQKSSGVKS
jgi:hypothetical protein